MGIIFKLPIICEFPSNFACMSNILSFDKCIYSPISVAEQSKVRVCDRSLAGIEGLSTAGGHGCLSHVNVVCCQGEIFATGRSLFQRSLIECGVSK